LTRGVYLWTRVPRTFRESGRREGRPLLAVSAFASTGCERFRLSGP